MQITFVFSASPYAGARAQEGLDALLMGSAFAQCSAVFVGDAVRQLKRDQQPEPIGHKNYVLGFAALPEYGVNTILCSRQALDEAGLSAEDLVIEVTVADNAEIRTLLEQSDKVLTL